MEKNNDKPKLRFPGFTDPWEQRKLGEVAERVTRKNKDLESTLPLTISAQDGLVDQNMFFNKTVASRDVSGYYLVKNGEFAYNKSYSNGYPWGAVKRLDRYDMGVLSTLYIVFKLTDVNSDFLTKYYDTTYWYHEVSKHAAEGARNHGLLNIAASDFFETELTIPKDKAEQEKIGRFFNNIDHLITLHQRKLNHLKDKKKSLLQKMFPKNGEDFPELRFPGFTDSWEQRKLKNIVDVKSGRDYKHLSEGKIPVYGTGGYMLSVNEALSYKEDAIGIGRKGTIDKPYILRAPFWTVDTLFYAVPENNNNLNFVYDIFQNIKWKQKDESTGVPSLSKTAINNVDVLIPDYKEQKQIGDFFQDIDHLITLHQRKLNHLKEQKKALLQQMFI
jgi:type I restriction enzyme S subunit